MNLLKKNQFKCSVSSVLNRDTKQNGKKFMFDGDENTSWNSNEGKPQWINIKFQDTHSVSAFTFQFQGGFVGNNCTVIVEAEDGTRLCQEPFFPDDINAPQLFKLKTPITNNTAKTMKFLFGDSTDFFGRVIVYKLEIF